MAEWTMKTGIANSSAASAKIAAWKSANQWYTRGSPA
jgi:hypothetical protein